MDDYKEFDWLILALEKDLDRRWEEYLLERAEKQKQQLQPEKSPEAYSLSTENHHHRHGDPESPNARKSRNKAKTPAPEREMPALLREHITTNKGGRDIKLVIQKCLYKSDLSKSNSRFSIPITQVKSEFLTGEEEEFLRGRNGKGKVNEARVTLVEPTVCDETVVSFRRWEMEKKKGGRSSSSYVLVASWMGVVERNGFRVGDSVQLWSFRVGGELHFAMVVVHRASGGTSDEDEAEESESE